MSRSHEFYGYADEHFGWAETARTEQERAIFLQMATAWLEVAQQWESNGSSTNEPARCRIAKPSSRALNPTRDKQLRMCAMGS
jgi:hypothetical protein